MTRVHVIQNVYITSRCCEVNFEPLHFVDEYNITTPLVMESSAKSETHDHRESIIYTTYVM